MPWNQPGSGNDNNNDKDPWTGKPKKSGPPDLEGAIRDFRKKLSQFLSQFSSSPKKDEEKEGKQDSSPRLGGIGLTGITVFIVLAWLVWGIFIVGPAEKAVILRFGKYVATLGPGPHWIPRVFETPYLVNEQRISNYSYNAEMLTKDQNIVSVAIAVQYRIGNARNYLFNVVKPNESLQQATASALRQVIGRTNLDEVLTSGREQIRQLVQQQLSSILDRYQTGLLITDVAMQPAKAPDEVKEAFDDAIKAQEDEQRFENQAQAYAMQVVPIAKGQAKRMLAEAKAYQQQVVLKAQADIAPFLALLPEYTKAPQVTRERLYLETLQAILTNNKKVMVDTTGNNMFYLPLDQLMRPKTEDASTNPVIATSAPLNTPTPSTSENISSQTSQSSQSMPSTQGGY